MKRLKLLSFLLAGLFLGACSSDEDTDAAYTETSLGEAPVWQINWKNNQERPDWTKPDLSAIYENWTTLQVQIEETLRPYASEGDLMALFVNGELRGLTGPAVAVATGQSDNGRFLMKVWGNESGSETVSMSLQYYSQTLKHVFTLQDDITLNSDVTIGIDEDFIPPFTYGSAKYPVVKTTTVEPLLTRVGLTAAPGGKVAAFVGDDCRGTATLSASGSTPMVVYGRRSGDSLTLKYYDAATGKLYTIPGAVTL